MQPTKRKDVLHTAPNFNVKYFPYIKKRTSVFYTSFYLSAGLIGDDINYKKVLFNRWMIMR